MCSGIEYRGRRLYFKDSPDVPLLRRDGGVEWVQWGLPYGTDLPGIPPGGCARLESVRAGKWNRLGVRPVRILCSAFMERGPGPDRAEHWSPVSELLAIQGALIVIENKIQTNILGRERKIVYVVTEPAGPDVAPVHDRQPRLVSLK